MSDIHRPLRVDAGPVAWPDSKNCSIPNCTNAVRWHRTLCVEHARKVPETLQQAVYRTAATLTKSRRPRLVLTYGQRYRECLAKAVRSVRVQR